MTNPQIDPKNPPCQIGVMGLAVMGENLILNIASRGIPVACYNRTVARVDEFMAGRAAGQPIYGAQTPEEFFALLQRPRRVLLMVKAGSAVDSTISAFLPYLEPGDIIMDGGNSLFTDTARRADFALGRGLLYIGTGVSGGEEGALRGPSIMPGGHIEAWPHVQSIFQAIAARAPDGTPCCDWVGPDGAGHFVKMVHNGIEYGDMQVICEAYHIMREVLAMDADSMARTFADWNTTDLSSYLIEITSEILAYRDPKTNEPTVDSILDAAGQKGTGKWTVDAAMEAGIPLTLISEAVFARSLSAQKEERVEASRVLKPNTTFSLPRDHAKFLENLRLAVLAAKIISYAQGFALIRATSDANNWNINLSSVAQMWRAGCIIRSAFLDPIAESFRENPNLSNLLLAPYFAERISKADNAYREVLTKAISFSIPTPTLSSALAYLDGYRCARLPANLLQAQRDYFGAHTYERTDRPRGEFFHTNWTGQGGNTTSGSYGA